MFGIDKTTSILLCGALIKKDLDMVCVDRLLKLASFYGYKKSVLFWLKESKKYTNDKELLDKIDRKITLLNKK